MFHTQLLSTKILPLTCTALLTKALPTLTGGHRTIIIRNLPVGTIVNGTVIGASGTITIPLTGGNTIPPISLTPIANFSGDMTGITVTLQAQDTDSDSSHTPAVVTDTVTLDLHVDPIAGDVTMSVAAVTTAEDTAVKFLNSFSITDTDGSEK